MQGNNPADAAFLSKSVQDCQDHRGDELRLSEAQLREMAKCIARNVGDVSKRPAKMMANVEMAYWKIYLAQMGVTLETIGDRDKEHPRMCKLLENHNERRDGNRLVVIYNNGIHYQLVADPRWITDAYADQNDAANVLLQKEIIDKLIQSIADDAELERKIAEVKRIRSSKELDRYRTRERLKATLVDRIRALPMDDDAERDRMVATVDAMTTADEIVQYDKMVDIMMSGGAKSTGYVVPAALALVTLVMSMVPR